MLEHGLYEQVLNKLFEAKMLLIDGAKVLFHCAKL